MKVKLKVLKGSSAGKEIKIPTPKCLVGRTEECHLRPKSDAISRRHCVLYVKDGQLLVRDLQSKNGTFVNGERIEEDRVLKLGDTVGFGPLQFEVLIDHSLGGEKKPKVKSIKEAAARTTSSNQDTLALEDSDISEWLEEADETQRSRQVIDPETRQLRLDETDQVSMQKAIEERSKQKAADLLQEEDAETKEISPVEKGKRKKPGKLPQRPDMGPKDSREAASEMLKKFFNKR
jgi:predicted component of type VI protein secretion system